MIAKVEPSKAARAAARAECPYDHDHGTVSCGHCRRIALALDAFAAEAVLTRERLFCEAVWDTLDTRDIEKVLAYVNARRDAGQEGAAVGACCAEAVAREREGLAVDLSYIIADALAGLPQAEHTKRLTRASAAVRRAIAARREGGK